MGDLGHTDDLFRLYFTAKSHAERDYFALLKELVALRNQHPPKSQAHIYIQNKINRVYDLILDEITTNEGQPLNQIKFGTSGWRGIIGKDLFIKSVQQVTMAIIDMYLEVVNSASLRANLGVKDIDEARKRGVVLGFDNRFGNEIFAKSISTVLTGNGFTVHYAAEATTGILSAAVLELKAACSINLTPSHNPLDYGGFKFNAADGGPAQPIITNYITQRSNKLIKQGSIPRPTADNDLQRPCNAMQYWQSFVRKGKTSHNLDYEAILERLNGRDDIAVMVDCVHGSSKSSIKDFFLNCQPETLTFFRTSADPTFGGIAPEPTAANMAKVKNKLAQRQEPLKLGVIMDPDADRIRLTDGTTDIDMNHFGAMSYHFLHEKKGLKGMVAKTVATSNFVNAIAESFHEEIFEPRVGFKEFKPVINKALVCFEESDGMTVCGHTPEKDAYIGLLLALDLTLSTNKNLGTYLTELQEKYGYYYPAKDSVPVSQKGDNLLNTLARLDKYQPGTSLRVGNQLHLIERVIGIDGHKIILDDGSWLMIRPSGTEPKVRFYVEARSAAATEDLFNCARKLLTEIGLA